MPLLGMKYICNHETFVKSLPLLFLYVHTHYVSTVNVYCEHEISKLSILYILEFPVNEVQLHVFANRDNL